MLTFVDRETKTALNLLVISIFGPEIILRIFTAPLVINWLLPLFNLKTIPYSEGVLIFLFIHLVFEQKLRSIFLFKQRMVSTPIWIGDFMEEEDRVQTMLSDLVRGLLFLTGISLSAAFILPSIRFSLGLPTLGFWECVKISFGLYWIL